MTVTAVPGRQPSVFEFLFCSCTTMPPPKIVHREVHFSAADAQLPQSLSNDATETNANGSFFDLACSIASNAIYDTTASRAYRAQMCNIAYEILLLNKSSDELKALFKSKIREQLGEVSSSSSSSFEETKEIRIILGTIELLNPSREKLDNVIGVLQAKEALKTAIELPIKMGSILRAQNMSPPQGVLLYGPPGTGKTIIVKAVTAQTGATYIAPTAAQINAEGLGESEKIVKAIFTVAIDKAPSVIFMDEFDTLVNPKNKGPADAGIRQEFLVNMLSTEFTTSDCAFIAASNYPNNIEAAIRSRLGQKVYLGVPSEIGYASSTREEAHETYEKIFKLILGSRAPDDLGRAIDEAMKKNLSARDIREIGANAKSKILDDWNNSSVQYRYALRKAVIIKDEEPVITDYCETHNVRRAEFSFDIDKSPINGSAIMSLPIAEITKVYMPRIDSTFLYDKVSAQPGLTQEQLDAFKLGTENTSAPTGSSSSSATPSFYSELNSISVGSEALIDMTP